MSSLAMVLAIIGGCIALGLLGIAYVLHTQLGYIFASLCMLHDQLQTIAETEGLCSGCAGLEEN